MGARDDRATPRRAVMRGATAAATAIAVSGIWVPATGPAAAAGSRAAAPRTIARSQPAPPVVVPTAADTRMISALTSRLRAYALGSRMTGQVRDTSSGKDLWQVRPGLTLMPASNSKLATAVSALNALGPARRLITSVRKGTRVTQIVLVGVGDPSLTGLDLQTLANQTVANLRGRGLARVSLLVDDSLFGPPSLAPGWSRSYYPGTVAPVRALVVDQRNVMDTGLDAGRIFAAKLKTRGVTVVSVTRGKRAAGAPMIATVRGQPIGSIVKRMLFHSDNDIAESLFRLTAIAKGYPSTWRGAAMAQRAVLWSLHASIGNTRMYDGSGLSRSSRMTSVSLISLLALAVSQRPEMRPIYWEKGLPIAGVTGTLRPARGRFSTAPSSCARGLLLAKTGTLRDVVSLSGVALGKDGRLKLFSFIVNGPNSTITIRRRVDSLAATVTGCF